MKEFFGNIKQEWNKMTWPTDKEMKLHSTQVFVFMLILTLFFAAIDGVISVGIAAATDSDDAPVLEYDYDGPDVGYYTDFDFTDFDLYTEDHDDSTD